jgi:hypothetical protein
MEARGGVAGVSPVRKDLSAVVRVLLDEPRVFVTYGSASVVSGDDEDGFDLDEPWADESNGLCGAGVPGVLVLQIGTHTGWIPFRVELHDAEPSADDSWDEIVEVSFSPSAARAQLAGLDGDVFAFALPRGDYRVRYCIRGMEEADTVEEPPDSYLLQFWPAAAAPGRIVKRTGERAAYWHRARRTLTGQEQREDERAEVEELAGRARERWGGRIPNERLRATLDQGLYLETFFRLDPDLEFALADATDATHRQVTAWAALRSLEQAGLIDLREIAPAVAALRRGERVPAPFDDSGYVWSVLERANPVRTSVPVPPDGDYEQSPQDWAITTLFHSAMDDSLAAVLEVLVCLAFVHGRDGYRRALAAVREKFPQLA